MFKQYLLSTTPVSRFSPMSIRQMAELCAQLGAIKSVWDKAWGSAV